MISDMPRKLPLFVCRERDRHGKLRFYFRRGKGKRISLPSPSDEGFQEAYERALTGTEAPRPVKAGTGSLEWLINQYRQSSAYLGYSRATRRQRDNIFHGVLKSSGHVQYRNIRKSHIIDGRESRSATPAQARNFLDAMRGLFGWAAEAQLIDDDPTLGVKNPKRRQGKGFEAWTDAEVEQYRNHWPLGTHERVWIEVLIGCGARRGDAVTLGKQHMKNGLVSFRTEKGSETVTAHAPVLQSMLDAIQTGPCGDLTFIVGKTGRPYTKESFGNEFKRAAVAAGILGKSAHGLRKFAATRYAELGLSEAELEPIFGWVRGSGMAAYYTKEANRRSLAEGAAARIVNIDSPNLDGATPNLKKRK